MAWCLGAAVESPIKRFALVHCVNADFGPLCQKLEHEAGDLLREMGVYNRFVQIMTKL